MKLKKNDTILVISGKDKGKKGKIMKVNPEKLTIVVEGINIQKKHQRPTQKFQGGIIERPGAISVSKVLIMCPRCGKPARLNRARVCKACGVAVDKEK